MNKDSIANQFKRNTVALISLVVAITSLAYNTWRNEYTERNRNLRFAAFEILLTLSELEELVFVNFYDCDSSLRGGPRSGWTKLLTIEDLSLVLEDEMPPNVDRLREAWAEESPRIDFESAESCRALKQDDARRSAVEESVQNISAAIDLVREDVRGVLYSLD